MKNDLRLSCIAALADTHLTGPDGPIPLRFVADSRLVVPGDAFVAFRGEQVNGHDFIHDAVSRGASLIICEESAGVPNHVASIVVDNCFSAIPRMARRYLEIHRESLEVLAVTGSVGKTTTREMIRTCLAPSFKVHSAEHSYNTLIGCALSILAMPADTEILILEMGTNHPGEIGEMVDFFPPTISMITEVAPAHLEGLGSVEGVAQAKFEITGSPFLKAFFYFGDNPLLVSGAASLPSHVRSLSVGFGENDFSIRDTEFILSNGLSRLTFDVVYKGKTFHASSPLFGRHSALAAGFGIALSLYLGASIEQALQSIESLQPPCGRGRFFLLTSGAMLLDDSYNANPASMKASLSESLRIPVQRRIAVLGEMKELGKSALDYHRELLPFFTKFSKVFIMGTLWRTLFQNTPLPDNTVFFDNPLSLGTEIKKELGEGDLIVVKGSHGNRLDFLVDFLVEEGVE